MDQKVVTKIILTNAGAIHASEDVETVREKFKNNQVIEVTDEYSQDDQSKVNIPIKNINHWHEHKIPKINVNSEEK